MFKKFFKWIKESIFDKAIKASKNIFSNTITFGLDIGISIILGCGIGAILALIGVPVDISVFVGTSVFKVMVSSSVIAYALNFLVRGVV